MTYWAWWDMDDREINGSGDAATVIEEAWSAFYPFGGRGIAVSFGPVEGGQDGAPLRIEVDIDAGRAAVHWLPDDSYGTQPEVGPHHEPLTINVDCYAEPISVPAVLARVTPGAAIEAASQYLTNGERPTNLEWSDAKAE